MIAFDAMRSDDESAESEPEGTPDDTRVEGGDTGAEDRDDAPKLRYPNELARRAAQALGWRIKRI